MLSIKEEKQIREILEERIKWAYFFDILSRKYVWIPLAIVALYLIDNPNISIIKSLISLIKN